VRLAASALVTTVLLVGSEGALRAEDNAALFLPISEAIAFSKTREQEPIPPPQDRQRTLRPVPGAKPTPPAFIPKGVELTDHYAATYDREAPGFASPMLADRQVAFGLWKPTKLLPGCALAWDTEDPPIGETSDRVYLTIELPF
jgi:hypothetical protein